MAQSYTRQSTFVDGDTITAALFNDEYNQLENAFTYSSSSASSTGHRHDGTAGHGGNVHTIGDLDFLNKIVVDSTNNRWGFFVEVSSSAVEQIRIQDGAVVPVTDNDIDLGTSSLEFKDLFIDGTAHVDTLDVDANATIAGTLGVTGVLTGTSLDISGDIDIDGTTNLDAVDIDGAVDMASTLAVTGVISPSTHIDMPDSANIKLGTGDDLQLYHDGTNSYITNATGALKVATETSGIAVTIGHTTSETTVADNLTVTGNAAVGGNLTVTGTTTFNGGTITMGDAASDNVVFGADVNSNIIPNTDNSYDLGSSSQEWKDLYVDGIAYLDGINFNGTAISATAAELNIMDGVTSTAAELNILDGVTSTAAELNILDGVTSTAAELNILDGVTSTTAELNILDGVTSTTAELNILDGATVVVGEINALDLGSTAVGTAIASKAVILDSNKDYTGVRNFTITGELDAATLDISGDADIDGTLEADAITIGGVTLAETIADTVGAMVSSNTESGITVSYEDADNTLDFTVGTLNQDTTGTADNFTVSANNSSDETVYPVFVDGATGSQGAETDTGLTYNPSTGLLTATGFSGNLTGTLQTAAQTNITSLGTLTALTGGTGDFNWDSNTLVVDSSANRVGILNAAPDVSLDVGSATDAVHMPTGTTAQRPGSPAAGYFRYNTTLGKFEGYTDEWGSIGGGAGTNMDTNIYTGDGSTTAFTLSTAPDDEQNLMVFVDGVFQAHNAYSVSGTTLTLSAAPASGRVITAFHSTTTVGGSNNTINTMTGDNSDTTLTLSVAPVHENNVQVYFDGVYQSKSNYAISGTTLTFSTAPPTGVLVEAITNTNTSSTTANILLDADSDTKIQVEESSDEDTIRMDIAGTEVLTLTNSAMTLKGTTPTLTIGDAGAEDTKIVFDGNAQDFYIGLDDSADDLVIGKGSTVGTTPAISIDEDLKSTLVGQVVIDPADGVADEAYALFVRNNEATDGRNYGLTVRGGSTSADESFSVRDHANASTYFKVRGDGNVGIGTAAPAEMLEIYNATSPAIQLNDGGDYQGIVRLAGNDLEIRGSSGAMEFYTGNADGDSSTLAMSINSSQKVHISSAENQPLRVESTDAYSGIELKDNGSSTLPPLISALSDTIILYAGHSSSRPTVLSIDQHGHVRMPLQSSAGVTATSQSNIGSLTTLDFDTERFDQNGDFDTSNNTFTAPTTGKYLVCANVWVNNLDTTHDYYQLYVVTSNNTYYTIFDTSVLTGDPEYWSFPFSGVVDMDESDTVLFKLLPGGSGTAQADLVALSYISVTLLH